MYRVQSSWCGGPCPPVLQGGPGPAHPCLITCIDILPGQWKILLASNPGLTHSALGWGPAELPMPSPGDSGGQALAAGAGGGPQ